MSDPTKPPAAAERKRIAELEKDISPGTLYEIKRAAQEAALREALEGKHVSQPAHETPRAEPMAWSDKTNEACRVFFGDAEWSRINERGAEPEQMRMGLVVRYLSAPPPPDATSARVTEAMVQAALRAYCSPEVWEIINEQGREPYDIRMRYALTAALAQTHVQPEQAGEK